MVIRLFTFHFNYHPVNAERMYGRTWTVAFHGLTLSHVSVCPRCVRDGDMLMPFSILTTWDEKGISTKTNGATGRGRKRKGKGSTKVGKCGVGRCAGNRQTGTRHMLNLPNSNYI